MSANFKFWLGTLIAYILIILYAGAVLIMIYKPGLVPSQSIPAGGVAGIETVTTLIGVLISALIISVLAVTNTDPVAQLTGLPKKNEIRSIMIYGYALTWVVTGVLALVMGTILMSVKGPFVTTVSDLGASWLATAVASGYAYFGINRSQVT